MPENGLTRSQFEAAEAAGFAAQAGSDFRGALALRETVLDLLKDEKNWVQYKETKDDAGRETRIGYRGKTAVYLKDETGEWDSKDGTHWILKGSNEHRHWHGTVEIDVNQNYRTTNLDSGVSISFNKDGTKTKRIVGSNGVTVEVTNAADGTAVKCVDGTGAWTSSDGFNWTNAKTGATSQGTVKIDRFGRYLEEDPDLGEVVSLQSRELDRVQTRQAEITKAHGAIFPEPGDVIKYSKKEYATRPATLDELECLDKICQSNKQISFKDLRFSFIEPTDATDSVWLWGVYQHEGNSGKPQMLLFPANNKVDGWDALEGTLLHELVHHEQHASWGESQWGAASAPAEAKKLLDDLGWVYDSTNSRNHILDNKGREFRYNFDTYKWELMVNGEPDSTTALSSGEMRKIAKVTPATNYFTEPWEMHAEALALLRFDPHQLWTENKELYKLMRSCDQAEIDRRFGQASGKPKFIRGIGNDVVPNTDENRKALEKLEKNWNVVPKIDRLSERFRPHGCTCCGAV